MAKAYFEVKTDQNGSPIVPNDCGFVCKSFTGVGISSVLILAIADQLILDSMADDPLNYIWIEDMIENVG